jgi:hypothetical protein
MSNVIEFEREDKVITITITALESDRQNFLDVLEAAEVDGEINEAFSVEVTA